MPENRNINVLTKLGALFQLIPSYFQEVNKKDPLFIIIMSILSTLVMLLIVFRRKPIGELVILIINLLIVASSKKISDFLTMNQQLLMENKMISKPYFEYEGKFTVFVISLPIFGISLLATLNLIFYIIFESCRIKRQLKEQQKITEKTDKED